MTRIFFILSLSIPSASLAFTGERLPEQPEENGCDADVFPNQLATDIAVDYYQRHGIWAGIFNIGAVLQTRLEKTDTQTRVLHMRYRYVPIPGNRMGRNDIGVDQRVFLLRCDENWEVMQMGPYMSAKFP